MQLPEEFPHTRHEQYLMVMPAELLSGSEAATQQLLSIRYRSYLRDFLLPLVAEAAAQGLTVQEWAEEFVAACEGSPPSVFRPR